MAFRRAVVAAGTVRMVIIATGESLAAVVVFLQTMRWIIVPIAPSMIRIRSRRGVEQGVGTVRMQPGQGGMVDSGSGLVGDQRNHFEVRRTLLAGDRIQAGHLQAGLVDELAQLLVR